MAVLLMVGCGREDATSSATQPGAAPPAIAPGPLSSTVEAPPGAPDALSGIGIRPILAPHGFAVGQVFPNSPAERAGLKVGDVVIDVDGESSARWTLDRVAERLRGPIGSSVALTFEREGTPMKLSIKREALRDIPAVPR